MAPLLGRLWVQSCCQNHRELEEERREALQKLLADELQLVGSWIGVVGNDIPKASSVWRSVGRIRLRQADFETGYPLMASCEQLQKRTFSQFNPAL